MVSVCKALVALVVEAYLGSAVGRALRGRVAATLDSLRVAADA
jgi:hypothetical protein